MRFSTERIFVLGEDAELEVRAGSIELDVDEQVTDVDDAQRALHVHGLQARDLFVFMELDTPTETTVAGYIVTQVEDETGHGVITAGDAMETSPLVWLNERTRGALLLAGSEQLAEFSLQALDAHLRG